MVDRLVAVATTRPDADLRHYIVPVKVQKVVDANLSTMREMEDERGGRPEPEATGPAERWTATIVPVRILRV